MRKSGPFSSIRLCAKIDVEADEAMSELLGACSDVPTELAEGVSSGAVLLDRRRQTTKISIGMQIEMAIARRTRI